MIAGNFLYLFVSHQSGQKMAGISIEPSNNLALRRTVENFLGVLLGLFGSVCVVNVLADFPFIKDL